MLSLVHLRPPLNMSPKEALSHRTHHRIGRGLTTVLLLIAVLLFSHRAAQAANGDPTLSIPTSTVNVMNGTTISLPITFADAAATNSISALSFSLDFDETCLTFDSITDTNSDGIPNSVTGLPSGYVSTISYSASDTGGEIDLTINDQVNPQTALSDGVLVTFQFGVQSSCRTTNGATESAPFAFDATPIPTFGDLLGAAVTGGTNTNGTYTLRFNANPTDIALTATSVAENVTLATAVGTLSSADPDTTVPGDSHSYSLVSGTGDTDNDSFVIDGSTLRTYTALNFELKSSEVNYRNK
jgi:hypothetical protein